MTPNKRKTTKDKTKDAIKAIVRTTLRAVNAKRTSGDWIYLNEQDLDVAVGAVNLGQIRSLEKANE